MTVNRRRLMRSIALGSGGALAQGQPSAPPIDALRSVAAAHGMRLDDLRLRGLQPVLQRRSAQIQSVRDFPVDDTIEPHNGCF
jgi:hypothetical protein